MDRVHVCVAAGLLILLIGCDLTPGKPFSWKATVDTEFTVPAGRRLSLFSYQFDEPFQVDSGAFKGKMQFTVPRSMIGTVPHAIDLRFSQFRLGSNATSPIDFYDVTGSLKVRRFGSSVRLTYTFSDRVTPSFNFLASDNLQVSLQPSGGEIGKGYRVFGFYTFIPAKGTAGSTTTTSSTTTTLPATTTTTTLGTGGLNCSGAFSFGGGSNVTYAASCVNGGPFTGAAIYFPSNSVTAATPPSGFSCQAMSWSPGPSNNFLLCNGSFPAGIDVTGGPVSLSPSPMMGVSLNAKLYVSMSSGEYGPFSMSGP